MRVLAGPHVDDERQDATEEKYSENAVEYCDSGADGAAWLSTPPYVVGGFFDWSSMKTGVRSRGVIGWVVAEEIGHWNLLSNSEIQVAVGRARGDLAVCDP